MSTAELKYNIFEIISKINDDNRLQAILSDLSVDKKDWWEEISEAERTAIEEGLKDIEEGRTLSHNDAIKSIESKYPFLKKAN